MLLPYYVSSRAIGTVSEFIFWMYAARGLWGVCSIVSELLLFPRSNRFEASRAGVNGTAAHIVSMSP